MIGDRHGALTLGAAAVAGVSGIRTHQDPLLGERALARNSERLGLQDRYASHALDEDLLRGAKVVLLQLPRGLDALDEIAAAIARWADPSVTVFAGGRVKHMTLAMNEVLARSFTEVSAGLGWRKARVLTAAGPRAVGPSSYPRWGEDPDLSFSLAAHGATFGGPTLDHGSRLLLAGLGDAMMGAERIVDLGCGNGVLAVAAALASPRAQVIATDQSAAAVAATLATAEAAGVTGRVAVHRADGAEAILDGWADLILLNPPFHSGSTVHTGVAHRLIRSCSRALAPGGELRLVLNSHLGYRPLVERVIGPVQQVARDRTFTVLSAIRR
ncbi:class I SAM-dependent methyltransferase [Leucobacter insecticola]|uniref:class I SAM-dependent methyltransferase n=1 Tax=Leucobacter insecticola TaxID=2714934 RepID=UPI00313836D0